MGTIKTANWILIGILVLTVATLVIVWKTNKTTKKTAEMVESPADEQPAANERPAVRPTRWPGQTSRMDVYDGGEQDLNK